MKKDAIKQLVFLLCGFFKCSSKGGSTTFVLKYVPHLCLPSYIVYECFQLQRSSPLRIPPHGSNMLLSQTCLESFQSSQSPLSSRTELEPD